MVKHTLKILQQIQEHFNLKIFVTYYFLHMLGYKVLSDHRSILYGNVNHKSRWE